MDNALLELILVGSIGLVMCVVGFLIHEMKKKKVKKCTQKITGQVLRYKFNGDGHMAPIVKYSVDGKDYFVKRKFNGIITKTKITPTHYYVSDGAYVDEKDYLHVPQSAITNLQEMAEKLWPIGSDMDVYYDPFHPQTAYVQYMSSKISFVSLMFIGIGLFIIMISIIMFFVMQS